MEEMEDEEELLDFSDTDEDDTDQVIAELSAKRTQLRDRGASGKLSKDNEKDEDTEFSESELSDSALEEKEARLIQRRHAEQISEHDFDYEFAQLVKASEVTRDKKENIQEDLSDLSNKQKWQLIKNTSPDLIPVIKRLKSLLPVCGDALSCSSVSAADERANLSIDYCMNIGIYLILKILREPDVHNHPITQRLLDYQRLMQLLESTERASQMNMKAKGKRHKLHEVVPCLYNEVEVNSSDEEEKCLPESIESNTDVGRRTITDHILKNRGLTPHRKKEHKNPRVKHRLKYRKAVIRRRGQIRPVRHELTAYAGEASGIRAAVKRGVRLKA